MLRKFKFVIAALLIIVTNQAVSYAVSAAASSSLLAAGTTRYAMAGNETPLYRTASATWEPAKLSTSVVIPAGKTADVAVLFCSLANANSNVIKVRATIGTALLVPNMAGAGAVLVADSNNAESHCVNFFKAGVSAGTKTVKIEWYTGILTAVLYNRTMIVILNIH